MVSIKNFNSDVQNKGFYSAHHFFYNVIRKIYTKNKGSLLNSVGKELE